ncbi:hypothetical protein ACXIVK_26885 [Paraburkholderia caledonica]
MVEPSRKRSKGTPRSQVVSAIAKEAASSLEIEPYGWHIRGKPHTRLCEFADGRTEEAGGSGKNWKGPFTGRSTLVEEIGPYLWTAYRNSSESIWSDLRKKLREVWRALDSCANIAPVSRVADLNDIHGATLFRREVPGDYVRLFLQGANAARKAQGLPLLYWPKFEKPTGVHRDVPPIEQIKPLYFALKHRVFEMVRRWECADAAATIGTDWSSQMHKRPQNAKWSVADLHATYRGVAAQVRHPCPSRDKTKEWLKTDRGQVIEAFPSLTYGLFPSPDDVRDVMMLFLLRTGFNGATALDIDVSETAKWIRPHPTSPDHHIVFAIKKKGLKLTEQVAIGLNKSALSAGNLIKTLAERTEPLRKQLRKELDELTRKERTYAIGRRIDELRRLIKSPWLYVSPTLGSRIQALKATDYSLSVRGKSSALLGLIKEVNLSRKDSDVIPESITLKQFRDVYISFAYSASGHSWLVAQLAAGHSSVETLKNYFRRLRWKMHGERVTRNFLEKLWGEIERRKIVEPAVLFAMVQNKEVTDEQVVRWLNYKDRTRVGVGCSNIRQPPPEIAPAHPKGMICRVQRCSLCRYAIVFEDSCDLLVRRLAELRHIKETIPLATWHASSFAIEQEATEKTLRLFESARVDARLEHWLARIIDGTHKPFNFEGEYGKTTEGEAL